MTHRLAAIGIVAWLLLSAGCADEKPPAEPEADPPQYGALVTPRVSYEADPLLADAYQALTGDRYQIAHTQISWREIALGPTTRDWEPLDRQVRRALTSGVRLSIVFEFLHGGEIDLPAYYQFIEWSWDEPTLYWDLIRFLRELGVRSQGMVEYFWLGEGIDRYAERYPESEPHLLPFYEALVDSLRAYFPEARLGVAVNLPELERTGRHSFIRSFRDLLGGVALSVYPVEAAGAHLEPGEAMALLQAAVEGWSDGPVAVIETGYSSMSRDGSDEARQSAFAALVGEWLHARPEDLELFCWSPIHDARTDLALSLAGRRHPNDAGARDRLALIYEGSSLRRMDGTRKPAREVFLETRP